MALMTGRVRYFECSNLALEENNPVRGGLGINFSINFCHVPCYTHYNYV